MAYEFEEEHGFGKGKVLFKSKGFDKAEKAHNAKAKALKKLK